jgi:hypothetical protein
VALAQTIFDSLDCDTLDLICGIGEVDRAVAVVGRVA